MAKTIGFFAMLNSIFSETMSAIESPINTSASNIASSKVSMVREVANSSFEGSRFSLVF